MSQNNKQIFFSLAGKQLNCDENGNFLKPKMGLHIGTLTDVTIQGSGNNASKGFKLELVLEDGSKCNHTIWFTKSNGQSQPNATQSLCAIAIKFGYTKSEVQSESFEMPVVGSNGTLAKQGFFANLIAKNAKIQIELQPQTDKDGVEHEKGYLRLKNITKIGEHVDVPVIVNNSDEDEKQKETKKRKTKSTTNNDAGYESGTDTSTNNNNNNMNDVDEPKVKAVAKKRTNAKKVPPTA